jgi:hypothetical protein
MKKIVKVLALTPLAFIAACDSGPGSPASVLAVGSTSVTAAAGTAAADSIAIKVVDDKGKAVPNVAVIWLNDPNGHATVSGVAKTDGHGVAKARLVAGTVAGPASVSAQINVDNTPVTASFAVTVIAGPAATLVLPVSTTLGVSASRTLTVSAKDQYGNTASTTGVTWQTSSSTIADVAAGVITSKAVIGAARVTATLGAATAGVDVWVVPATINECETNTQQVCGTWTLSVDHYDALWSQGSTATVQVAKFSADSVRFVRTDNGAGTSPNQTAVYEGLRAAGNAAGAVRWSDGEWVIDGTWSATW